MPLYIAQSGDLDRCYRCLTDRLTTLKDRATQLLIQYKSGALVTQFKIALDAGSWIRHFSWSCPWPEQLFGTNHSIHICMRFVFLWNSNIWGCAPHPWEDWHSYGFWRSWEIRLSLFFPFSFFPSSYYSASFLFSFFLPFHALSAIWQWSD